MNKTTKKQTKGQKCIKNPEDINNIFFQKAFGLLFNQFSGEEEPINFISVPPMKDTVEEKAEAKNTFNSRITEIRVKRGFENNVNTHNEQEKRLEKRMELLEQCAKNNNENIDSAFEKEDVARPEIPAYIVHEQEDQEKLRTRRRAENRKGIDIANTVKQFEKRLKNSEENGKNSALKRRYRLEGREIKATQIIAPKT